MNMHSKFNLDVLASADLGQDTCEGPHQDRPDVSVSSFQRAGESVTILIDVAAAGPVELPLAIARQLADALVALVAELDA
jgi:hypothetical protein